MRAGNGTRGLHPASIIVASFWFVRAGKGTRGLHPASDRQHCLSLCTRDTIPHCSTLRGSFGIAIGSRRISLRVAVPSLRRSPDRGSPSGFRSGEEKLVSSSSVSCSQIVASFSAGSPRRQTPDRRRGSSRSSPMVVSSILHSRSSNFWFVTKEPTTL
ncbi:BnaC01g31140D [Brassica napus]|uniref:BnaC01g31140D protein n=2 Tax=Brassica TaxID=3705 RepID=A0A078F783_BRANA|nr:BnaC01g31140D [Brassica napus]